MAYRPLKELLAHCDVVFTCLNKNVILLGEEEFACLGNGKLLFNTSIGPSHEPEALKRWLDAGENYFICDTDAAAGDAGWKDPGPSPDHLRPRVGGTDPAGVRPAQRQGLKEPGDCPFLHEIGGGTSFFQNFPLSQF